MIHIIKHKKFFFFNAVENYNRSHMSITLFRLAVIYSLHILTIIEYY